MQPSEGLVSLPATHFRHTCLGTLLGTVGGFFARSVQKTEGKRDKATVFLTAAFDAKVLAAAAAQKALRMRSSSVNPQRSAISLIRSSFSSSARRAASTRSASTARVGVRLRVSV